MAYCNSTTDLRQVFPNIEQFRGNRIIGQSWTLTSGQTYTYQEEQTGFVDMVFEDGVMLTIKTSVANVEGAAGSFYYDADLDILYVRPLGSDSPDDHTIEYGLDWDAFKTDCKNKAHEWIDGWLNRRYPTPLQPRVNKDHSTDDYEYPIVRATAAMTCYIIASRLALTGVDVMSLYKIAWNPEPAVNEEKGIINQYLDGDILRQDDVSVRESASFNYWPNSSNTTDEPGLLLQGSYTGSQFQIWKLTITTGGAPGTALFTLSLDNGTTSTYTSQVTKPSGNDHFVHLSQGVYARFPAASYVQNDYWIIEVYPQGSSLEKKTIQSIRVSR